MASSSVLRAPAVEHLARRERWEGREGATAAPGLSLRGRAPCLSNNRYGLGRVDTWTSDVFGWQAPSNGHTLLYVQTLMADCEHDMLVRDMAYQQRDEVTLWVRLVRCVRATTLLALCVLVLMAGCGAPPIVVQRTSTHTPASAFVPTAVVGAIHSLRMFDATTGWAATSDRLLRTTDGGIHWRDVTPAPPSGQSLPSLAMFPRASDDAWVVRALGAGGPGASQSAVSHTTDGGRTWRTITLPVFAVTQITFADAMHGWMLADVDTADGEQGVDIFRTTDGGQSWARVASASDQPGALPLQGRKTGLTFRDATTGWASGAGPVNTGHPASGVPWFFETRDGGITWQLAPLALPASLAQYPWFYVAGVLPATFFPSSSSSLPEVGALPVAVGSASAGGVVLSLVYVTRDGGATWTSTSPAPTTPDAVSLPDPSHWWITANENAGASLFSTSDGGRHWTMLTPGAHFAHVSVLSFVSGGNLGWAIGSAGLLRTRDGGRTWTVLASAPLSAA